MLVMTIKGEEQLRDLARDLRRGKGTLRAELTKAFKNAGKATLDRVKHNMTSMQIKGYPTSRKPKFTASTGRKNLRARIARVTEYEVRTGSAGPVVRFVVRSGQLGKAKEVPYHLDTGKVFRHPIMGHNSWAGSSGEPWFYDEIRKDRDTLIVPACDKAIDRTVAKLEKG